MAIWLGNATDGVWGLRFLILFFAYIIGLVIGIFVLPPFYGNQFYSAQIIGISLALCSILMIMRLERSQYLQPPDENLNPET